MSSICGGARSCRKRVGFDLIQLRSASNCANAMMLSVRSSSNPDSTVFALSCVANAKQLGLMEGPCVVTSPVGTETSRSAVARNGAVKCPFDFADVLLALTAQYANK